MEVKKRLFFFLIRTTTMTGECNKNLIILSYIDGVFIFRKYFLCGKLAMDKTKTLLVYFLFQFVVLKYVICFTEQVSQSVPVPLAPIWLIVNGQ